MAFFSGRVFAFGQKSIRGCHLARPRKKDAIFCGLLFFCFLGFMVRLRMARILSFFLFVCFMKWHASIPPRLRYALVGRPWPQGSHFPPQQATRVLRHRRSRCAHAPARHTRD